MPSMADLSSAISLRGSILVSLSEGCYSRYQRSSSRGALHGVLGGGRGVSGRTTGGGLARLRGLLHVGWRGRLLGVIFACIARGEHLAESVGRPHTTV